MNFARYIEFWSRMRSDESVIRFNDNTVTWREFAEQSRGVAAAYQAAGVRHGDRVGCLLDNSIEWCLAFAGAILAGGVLVPLNSAFGYMELRAIERDAGCRIVVSTPALLRKLDISVEGFDESDVLVVDRCDKASPVKLSEALKNGATFVAPAYGDTDLFAIAYTSGTTGLPKGVMMTHASVDAMCGGLSACLGWTADDRFLVVAPLAFTGGFISKIAPVLKVGCSVRVEPSFEAARALRLIEVERITDFGGVPGLWQRLAEAPGFDAADLSSLKNGVTGGAPVPRQLLETFLKKGVLIRQQYGCTEAGGGGTMPTPRGAIDHPTSCGFAMCSLDLQVQDETGAPAPEGAIGEICVKGPQIMTGYWNQPEMTQSAFNGTWYRTGDLGRMDEHGLSVVDRKKNMVISGGVNIYPAEVERALSSVPGVAEIVVFGIPSNVWGEELVGIVHPRGELDLDAFRAEARERLGRMKTPKQFIISRAPLPRTVTNKVARTNLAALFSELSAKDTG